MNVSQVLSEEYVGLEEVNDEVWAVYFGPLLLGRFDERTLDCLAPAGLAHAARRRIDVSGIARFELGTGRR